MKPTLETCLTSGTSSGSWRLLRKREQRNDGKNGKKRRRGRIKSEDWGMNGWSKKCDAETAPEEPSEHHPISSCARLILNYHQDEREDLKANKSWEEDREFSSTILWLMLSFFHGMNKWQNEMRREGELEIFEKREREEGREDQKMCWSGYKMGRGRYIRIKYFSRGYEEDLKRIQWDIRRICKECYLLNSSWKGGTGNWPRIHWRHPNHPFARQLSLSWPRHPRQWDQGQRRHSIFQIWTLSH